MSEETEVKITKYGSSWMPLESIETIVKENPKELVKNYSQLTALFKMKSSHHKYVREAQFDYLSKFYDVTRTGKSTWVLRRKELAETKELATIVHEGTLVNEDEPEKQPQIPFDLLKTTKLLYELPDKLTFGSAQEMMQFFFFKGTNCPKEHEGQVDLIRKYYDIEIPFGSSAPTLTRRKQVKVKRNKQMQLGVVERYVQLLELLKSRLQADSWEGDYQTVLLNRDELMVGLSFVNPNFAEVATIIKETKQLGHQIVDGSSGSCIETVHDYSVFYDLVNQHYSEAIRSTLSLFSTTAVGYWSQRYVIKNKETLRVATEEESGLIEMVKRLVADKYNIDTFKNVDQEVKLRRLSNFYSEVLEHPDLNHLGIKRFYKTNMFIVHRSVGSKIETLKREYPTINDFGALVNDKFVTKLTELVQEGHKAQLEKHRTTPNEEQLSLEEMISRDFLSYLRGNCCWSVQENISRYVKITETANFNNLDEDWEYNGKDFS